MTKIYLYLQHPKSLEALMFLKKLSV